MTVRVGKYSVISSRPRAGAVGPCGAGLTFPLVPGRLVSLGLLQGEVLLHQRVEHTPVENRSPI